MHRCFKGKHRNFFKKRILLPSKFKVAFAAKQSIHALRDGDWKVKAGISPAVSEWLGSHALEKACLTSEQGDAQFEVDERLQVKFTLL